jgi:HlyD family secretion protein
MNARRRILRWVIPVIAVAVMGVGVVQPWQTTRAGAQDINSQASQTQATATSPTPTMTVIQTDVTGEGIGATGSVRSSQTTNLSWQASGKVAQVLVQKGDQVQKGRILAQLDTSSDPSWAATQSQLLSAQETLANLQEVAETQASAKLALLKAQAAVTDDQANLAALSSLPSQAAIDAWKAVYIKDQEKVTQAQENYDYWVAYEYLPHCAATSGPGGNPGGGAPGGGGNAGGNATCRTLNDEDLKIQQASALSALSSAQQTEENDLAQLTYLENYQPDPSLLADAQTKLALAQQQLIVVQANFTTAMAEPDPAAIALAQANIATIQATLDKQYLRAPFTGTITDLPVEVGDEVSGGTYALRIDNLSSLYINLTISEIDINQVKVGQTVQIQFDAIPDQPYSGTITNIDPVGNVFGGVATFSVSAVINNADTKIKPGMNALAYILNGGES